MTVLSNRMKCVILAKPGNDRLTANDAGIALENAGLTVGGMPSNRCLPGASVLMALGRLGIVYRACKVDGRQIWGFTPKGWRIKQELHRTAGAELGQKEGDSLHGG